MLETLHYFIDQYGYFAIAIGCFLEGEISVLLGVVAAQRELLTVPGVIAAATVGTIIADNFWFYMGRRLGRPALARRKDWRVRTRRAERLLARYGAPALIGYRFAFGLRTVAPFVFGSLNISPWRFLVLSSIGAVLWATSISVIGVLLARALHRTLNHIQNAEQAFLVVLLLATLTSITFYWLRHRKSRP